MCLFDGCPPVEDRHTGFRLGEAEAEAGAVLPLPALNTSPMRRLADALLTTEPMQRARLRQAGLAMLLLGAAALAMNYFAWAGVAPRVPMLAWSALTLAGLALFFFLIRSGWSRRRPDPSLTVPQMLFGLGSSAIAYALLGAGRGAVFPVVMVILVFGMFVASPRQMRWVSACAVGLLGAAMAFKAATDPGVYPPAVELGHFLLVAAMIPSVSALAGRLSRLRHRARLQRAELAQALARLREQTTRDELTGLPNRRHMLALIQQEHQRCTRSGQSFCLALLDIDRLKSVNASHGYACGDTVLRALSEEARRHVRVSDVLSRWSGGVFLLMMSDTHVALARGGLERLHGRLSTLQVTHGDASLQVALSAGLGEHRAGETVSQTLERVVLALQEAKALGGAQVVALS
ncbi:MAG TPA: GGDEF domain-containing protein [Rubrivivax sp.]|nr:GGDEF domain-containing protein [Rubrivivax sp.]